MPYAANTLENHWLPFTANRDFKQEPRLLVKGEGVHYWNHKGEKLLDGSSGLFCCAAGHARKEIAEAVGRNVSQIYRGLTTLERRGDEWGEMHTPRSPSMPQLKFARLAANWYNQFQ